MRPNAGFKWSTIQAQKSTIYLQSTAAHVQNTRGISKGQQANSGFSAQWTWFSRTSKSYFRTFVTKRSIFFGPTTLKMLMKLSSTITTEDRWVIGSIALTLSGIILGALLAEPRAFGITALTGHRPTVHRLVCHTQSATFLATCVRPGRGCAGTLGRLGACRLLPFARLYRLLRLSPSRLTLLYAYRLVADRRPVRLSCTTPGRSLASLVCCSMALAADLKKAKGLSMRKTCAVLRDCFGLQLEPRRALSGP